MSKVIAAMGGQLYVDFFRARLKSDNTYEWLAGLLDTASATPTVADAALSLTELVSTKPTPQDDGTYKVSWEQYESGDDVWAYLDVTAVPAGASGTKPEYYLQNGAKKGGGASSSEIIVPIIYAFGDADGEDATKIFVIIPVGAMDATSGEIELKRETYIAPSMTFTGSTVTKDLTIPAGLFRTELLKVSTLPTATIKTGKGFWRGFCDVAA